MFICIPGNPSENITFFALKGDFLAKRAVYKICSTLQLFPIRIKCNLPVDAFIILEQLKT